MWTCPKCKEELEQSFEICWRCGTDPEGDTDPSFVTVAEVEPEQAAKGSQHTRPEKSNRMFWLILLLVAASLAVYYYLFSYVSFEQYGPYHFVRSYRDNVEQRAFLFYADNAKFDKQAFSQIIRRVQELSSGRELQCVYVFDSLANVPAQNYESAGVVPEAWWKHIIVDYSFRKSQQSEGLLRVVRSNGRQWIFLDDPSSESKQLGLGGIHIDPEMHRDNSAEEQ